MRHFTLAIILMTGSAICLLACTDDGALKTPDASDGPAMAAYFTQPLYMKTAVPADASVNVLMVHKELSPDEALKILSTISELTSYPSGAPVSGSWTRSGGVASFTPHEPLLESEYRFTINTADSDIEVLPRSELFFRVGSLVRVRGVEILPDKERGSGYIINPMLSESYDVAQLAMSVKVQTAASKWSDVTLSKADGGYKVADGESAFSLSKRIRVEVTYPGLDGKYAGAPASGDFVAEFVPTELSQSDPMVYLPEMPKAK